MRNPKNISLGNINGITQFHIVIKIEEIIYGSINRNIKRAALED